MLAMLTGAARRASDLGNARAHRVLLQGVQTLYLGGTGFAAYDLSYGLELMDDRARAEK